MDKQAKHTPLQWTYDERGGCIAIYRGEKQNCLDGIYDDPSCIYFKIGYRDGDGVWCMRPADIANGKQIYNALNCHDDLLAALKRIANLSEGDELQPPRNPYSCDNRYCMGVDKARGIATAALEANHG